MHKHKPIERNKLMTLQSYEIQHPNPRLTSIVNKMQDLVATNQLAITQDGKNELLNLIAAEIKHERDIVTAEWENL